MLLFVRIGLWTLPFATVGRLVGGRGARVRQHPRAAEARRIGRTVIAVARRLPCGMTCLVEALAAQAMLRRRGYDSTLRFGVRRGRSGGRPIDAHAWLVCDGHVVVGEIEEAPPYATFEAGGN